MRPLGRKHYTVLARLKVLRDCGSAPESTIEIQDAVGNGIRGWSWTALIRLIDQGLVECAGRRVDWKTNRGGIKVWRITDAGVAALSRHLRGERPL